MRSTHFVMDDNEQTTLYGADVYISMIPSGVQPKNKFGNLSSPATPFEGH